MIDALPREGLEPSPRAIRVNGDDGAQILPPGRRACRLIRDCRVAVAMAVA